ncbi:MAG: nucleotidyl transferase AbiEii/AbiGii toxin family protein, partial [Pseudomonadota bacterium]
MTKNISASIRQRLLNLARQRKEDFQYVLVRYGLERFLYRLASSEFHDRFVLKGAALFSLWTNQPHRATRDIDLLGHGNNSIPQMEELFRKLCNIEVVEDGLSFLAETVRGQV